MKIGIVTTWLERGAAYVSRQYRDVLEGQHEVFIYARGGEGYAMGNPAWDGPKVTWGKKIPLGVPMSIDLADFKKWILSNKLDCVFFNEQQWWDPVMLVNKLGVKCGTYVDYYTQETVPFFGLYDFLVCNTKRHFSVFNWHSQALYVPWGTLTNVYIPSSSEPVNQNCVTFFHSCGVSPERKGTDLVLKAFAQLRGPAKLIIHSQIHLPTYYPTLAALISELEASGRLEIIERTVGAPGLYTLGDVYVYPSRLEGVGLTIAEALSAGLPVITSDHPPMNEFIGNECGKLVPVSKIFERADKYYWPQCEVSVDALAMAMQWYVGNLAEVVVQKKNARLHALAHLDWAKNNQALAAAIETFKVVPNEQKKSLATVVKQFEQRRSKWYTKLYRVCPWIFKPFSWLWPLITYFVKQ